MQEEIIIIPAFFLMLAFIVSTTVNAWQQRHRLRLLTQFNSHVIDRLGSIKDFSEFAKTDAGARFLDGVVADMPKVRPGERVLRAAQVGVILMTFAVGLLSVGRYLDSDGRDAFTVLGVISLSLGAGFLISSFVSHRIATALGLNATPPKPPEHR